MNLINFPNESRVKLHALGTHLLLIAFSGNRRMTRAYRLNLTDPRQLHRLCHFEQLRFVSKTDLLRPIKVLRPLLLHVIFRLKAASPLFLVIELPGNGGFL